MKDFMDANPKIKIQYSAKYAESSNYWKYFIGQTKGLKRLNVMKKNRSRKLNLQNGSMQMQRRKEKYGKALSDIANGYNQKKNYNLFSNILKNAFQGPEIIYFSYDAFDMFSNLKNPEGKDDAIKATAKI